MHISGFITNNKMFKIANKPKVIANKIPKLIPFVHDGYWGFCDKTKKIIIPCIYEDVLFYEYFPKFDTVDEILIVKKNGFWGGINKHNQIILSFIHTAVSYLQNKKLIKIKINNKWGVINNFVIELIPVLYNEIISSTKNNIAVEKNGFYAFFDNLGTQKTKFIHDNRSVHTPFIEGLKKIVLNNKWGYVDANYNVVIECKYEIANDFIEELGVAFVMSDGKYGLIDIEGNDVTSFIYDDIYDINSSTLSLVLNNLIAVCLNSKWGFINKFGRQVVSCIYDDLPNANSFYFFDNGRAIVVLNKKWGVIDFNGKYVIPCEYDYIGIKHPFIIKDSIASVCKNEKWGFFNLIGEQLIDFMFDEVKEFQEDLASVKVYNKWGYIDIKGKYSIHRNYDSAENFKNGIAIVSIYDKYGVIDKKGKILIQPIFSKIKYSNFENLVYCFAENKAAIFTVLGKQLSTFKYEIIDESNNDITIVCKNNMYGAIDKYGNELIPCIFIDLFFFKFGLALVYAYDKLGYYQALYIDKYGTQYWDD